MKEEQVIHKIFNKTVSDFPDKAALEIKTEEGWQAFTYRQAQALALKVGAFLIKEGFDKGDFIGLILDNRPEWAIIYLGINYAGLACVPLDPQLNQQDLENILNDCQAKTIFTSFKIFSEKIKNVGANLKKIIVLDLDKEEGLLVDFSKISSVLEKDIAWPAVSPEDTASLIYTSGTTARPKGVVLSHSNLCSNFLSIDKLRLCFASDNFLSILPLHHTYAFMVTLVVPLFIGAKITYAASFKPQDLSDIVNEAKVTILVGVPQLFSLLYKSISTEIKKIPFILRLLALPLIKAKVHNKLGKSLRLFVSGGARLQPEIASGLWRLGFKVIEGYGLTETSPVVTLNPPQRIKFGSVGKTIPEVEVRIFNPDTSGIGEVLIKGENVMRGYYKHPDLTAEVIKEGWFHSGDLGYLDKEGYLFLTGRKKDVIVLSSGKNIYPEELEDVFLRGSPYIKEICILGATEKKFGKETETLFAVIVPDIEYFRKNNEINVREKIRWEIENISKKLPSYQHIMGFSIAKEELPRTRLQKIKRYKVKQKYLREQPPLAEDEREIFSEEDRKVMRIDLAKKIIDYLTRELKKRVYLDSHLEMDLGIDSLSRVELGLGLEALLRLKIPPNLIEKVFTVRELILSLESIYSKEGFLEQAEFTQDRNSWAKIIKEVPSDKLIDKIKLTSGFLDKILTFIFKCFFWFIFRVFWLLRVRGREFIPKERPYIFCSNHASYLDGFVLFSSLPFDSAINIFFLGQAAIFEHPLVAWAIKFARLISIDPTAHLTEAMQACSFVLAHKKTICIFPEGSRSINEEVADFKKGIGILAKELNMPIIPVYIRGSHYSWPRGNRFPRPYPLKIIFGRPINWNSLGNDYDTIARGLRKEVLKLKEY